MKGGFSIANLVQALWGEMSVKASEFQRIGPGLLSPVTMMAVAGCTQVIFLQKLYRDSCIMIFYILPILV